MNDLILRLVRCVPSIRSLVLVFCPLAIMCSFTFVSFYQEQLSTAQFYRRLSAKMDITRLMAQMADKDRLTPQDTSKSLKLMRKLVSGDLDTDDVAFLTSQFNHANSSRLPLAYLFVKPNNRTSIKKTRADEPALEIVVSDRNVTKIFGMDNKLHITKRGFSNQTLTYRKLDLGRYSIGRRPEVWNSSKFVQDHRSEFECSIGLCFEPDLTPSTNGIPKIPRIIHQTWVDSAVPSITVQWIRKWLEMNPGYQYWLWTDKGIDNFITTKYSEYQDVFRRYQKQIETADAIRYFILYHYGGIYADLDIEPLKSFDPLVFSYSCLLTVEPDEHALLLRPQFANKLRILTSNAIMLCRPKHAFFKHIISGLISRTFMGGTLWRTGPAGMSKDLQTYLSIKRNDLCKIQSDRVAVTSQELLMPQFDQLEMRKVKGICQTKKYATKGLRPIVCKKLRENKFRNDVTNNSFSTHHWIHTWTPRGEDFKLGEGGEEFVPIHNIIPRVKLPYDNTKVNKTKNS